MGKFLDQNIAWVIAALVTVGGMSGLYYGVVFLHEQRERSIAQAIEVAERTKDTSTSLDKLAVGTDKILSKDEIPEKTESLKENIAGVDQVRWGYTGDVAPKFWGKLHSDFALCGSGKKQSPIDILRAEQSVKVPKLNFKYSNNKTSLVRVMNTGHVIRVEPQTSDNILVVGSKEFTLKHIDIHAASEHRVETLPFDMELQFYHVDVRGEVVAVGVFVTEGAKNSAVQNVWTKFPSKDDFPIEGVKLNIGALIPKAKKYYHYQGSLTIPPCSEGVNWFVFESPILLSSKQIDDYVVFMKFNSRAVQPLFGRKIFKN